MISQYLVRNDCFAHRILKRTLKQQKLIENNFVLLFSLAAASDYVTNAQIPALALPTNTSFVTSHYPKGLLTVDLYFSNWSHMQKVALLFIYSDLVVLIIQY